MSLLFNPCLTQSLERLVQQQRIEELIFEAKATDKAAITKYLEELFSEPEAATALAELRTKNATFGENLRKEEVEASDTRALIKSLLSRDLLSSEKTTTIKSFLDSPVIIDEVTSVLNMLIASLDTWDWPEDGVMVEMRRHLSGKYRAYMDNEIMQAILFQHIGMQWSVQFKRAFKSIVQSRAWKNNVTPLTRTELKRRQAFLRVNNTFSSIETFRRKMQLEQFFMTQLPSKIEEETPYDEEPTPGQKPNQGLNAQQVLLRLVSTEAHLQKALHKQCTIMRADLEWFGPSLPHDSILAVLQFFGMPTMWLDFVRKWLGAKLRFDANSQARTRVRGVPIAHSLSVLCGEAVLFGMDFAVNQRAGGLYLYRIYDDFWYFSHDSAKCATAWKEMNKYAQLVGITFNTKKTGGACVGAPLNPVLPKGNVSWGFLTFDEAQGRFVVDQAAVNVHIAELKRQLVSAKSVFGYVNALNKYLEFFRRNFAQPANCFGEVHADEVIATFGRIYREVFSKTDGSIVEQIRSMVEARFGIQDIPAGWCFIPSSEGGLGIVNPIVDLLTVRDNIADTPTEEFTALITQDSVSYKNAEDSWLAGAGESTDKSFMPFSEYILGRQTALSSWGSKWNYLQQVADASFIPQTGTVLEDRKWHSRSSTEKWVMSVYADDIKKRFGNLQIVEPTLIPVGMLSAFRDAKVVWDS